MEFRREQKSYDKKTVNIRRVSKVTAGGKRLRFSAMIVTGDRKGSIGVAVAKGLDTRSAIEKAEKRASTHMQKVQLIGDTIPHELLYKKGAAVVLLRPAKPGTGIVAGMAARNVLEMAGVENVYCKQLGSSDLITNTYCVYEALLALRKGRVLEKMNKMRERIGIKEKSDAEKQKLQAKKRASKKQTKVNNKKDGTFRNTKTKK
ncbi:30S ribosomal protein S5 [Candidatus Dojkabacteria bacterium]|jgi:small subunit ribosomal protein S5|nr:30S ribosomal protein S5 [Candidatus Dojkabacteria bacterium]